MIMTIVINGNTSGEMVSSQLKRHIIISWDPIILIQLLTGYGDHPLSPSTKYFTGFFSRID
jgi:hypothetical protein